MDEPAPVQIGAKSGAARVRVLSELEVGESGVLVTLDLPPGVQNHLMYMGFVPDARVRVLHKAPAGDPTVYSVDGIEIALRRETARAIWLKAASVIKEPFLADSSASNHSSTNQPQQATAERPEELTEALR